MRKLLWLLLLAGCQQTPPAPVVATPKTYLGTVVAFGDSLSEGLGLEVDQAYPAQLQRRLERDGVPWRVINAGISGETSSGARSRLEWVITQLKPDLVILETGANDGLRGLDPSLTEKNLGAMLTVLKAKRVGVLLTGMRVLKNSGKDYQQKFSAIYPRLARVHGVELMPFFLEGVAGKRELNQTDQLHPTEQGYAVIVNQLAPQIERMIARRPSSENF